MKYTLWMQMDLINLTLLIMVYGMISVICHLDGTKIAFSSARDRIIEIYVMDVK